ncbi:MAG: glycosyltransferase family 2 protein [Muribaculaceae bacterium]|nr:glycosyltransferase family 2 protein [Muribaculaceae bacterium]
MEISVIIPTYKNRGALARAIKSVLSQTFSDVEIIVVDDNGAGSPAQIATAEIIEEFSDDKRVKYIIHQENRNGAAARNTGIFASSAEFIAFLDDDDWFYPEKCELQRNFLLSHPEYEAVYCQGFRKGLLISSDIPAGSLSREILMGKSYMFTPSLMFRRNALLKIGGFDENFKRHQDYELLLRYFANGGLIAPVLKPLFEIGVNDGENIISGKRYEELKNYFLSKFDKAIKSIELSEPGFAKKCYAFHYGSVFMSYLKNKDITDALRILVNYVPLSPKMFFTPLANSLISHIHTN